jgi:DNA-3-methyladenine glycosylase
MNVLGKEFYGRSVLEVAPELLGKYLVVGSGRGSSASAHMITEVEAYDGAEDLACHASKGKTPRTEVMFGPAGRWYVYLIYGMYDMLNIVTGPEEHAAAVLIRGVGEYDGPGKLTRDLGITREHNAELALPKGEGGSGLWIEDRGFAVEAASIETTPRIGVDYAGPEWSQKPWRFVLRNLK